MSESACVIPLFDECLKLSNRIEEIFKNKDKIKALSDALAREILDDPKLSSMTESIKKHMLQLGADVAAASIDEIAQKAKKASNTVSKGERVRKLTTILGEVDYARNCFYDAENKKMEFPSDEVLDIKPGHLQKDLLSRVVKLGLEVPFEEASRLSEDLIGVSVSEGAIHKAVVEVGKYATYERVTPTKKEIHGKLNALSESNPGEPVHIVVGVDGAMEPLRPEGSKRHGKRGECFWKECKGFRAFAIVGESTIEQIASWHQICSDEELGAQLKLLGKSMKGRKEVIVTCADGAKWIWNQLDQSFKGHLEVLDWFHAIEHFSDFADIQYGNDKAKKKAWLDKTKERLMNDDIEGILWGLKRLSFKSKTAKIAAEKLSQYVDNNMHRMRYGTLRSKGLTIGSGGMEAANKSISHIRLKRNGAWWKASHANEILRLRCAKANGKLEEILSNCWGNA